MNCFFETQSGMLGKGKFSQRFILVIFVFFLLVFQVVPVQGKPPAKLENLSPIDTKFVTVRLNGQFGNQLFQIAAAYAYALDHNLFLTIPDLVSNPNYGIPHNAKTIFLRSISSYAPKLPPSHIWTEPHFNHHTIPNSNRIELRGYFQSEKYFAHRRKEIVELFAPPQGYNECIFAKYPFLDSDQLVVGVQIRDYRAYSPNGEYHPTLGRQYYKRAIARFPEDAIFMVSSNNLIFAKQCTEGLAKNIFYLDADYLEEFFTLVLCKSFIISNSSFGWWAAWLSNAENKRVIAPDPWFSPPYDNRVMKRDLIPSTYEVVFGG